MTLYLGIETSCDETSVAVVDCEARVGSGKRAETSVAVVDCEARTGAPGGRNTALTVLSNIVYSQTEIHKQYGGVVPEIASRNHTENIIPALDAAIKKAGIKISQIRAVAATVEPGLPGAVMVGRTVGESLGTVLNVPFIPVNHLYGHIASLKLSHSGLEPPFLCLLVSGGHTAIYSVADTRKNSGGWRVKLLLCTADDAVGEAFDKVARVLELPYPGGPKIEKEADKFNGELIKFVGHFPKDKFSYSGLKTAVINYVNTFRRACRTLNIPQICASFQNAAVGQLLFHSINLIKKYRIKCFGVCGGVAANAYLRRQFGGECEKRGIKLFLPDQELCGDNAAMIAAAAAIEIHI
jgi:N6-L-threonylcarbamoyladenine synthase